MNETIKNSSIIEHLNNTTFIYHSKKDWNILINIFSIIIIIYSLIRKPIIYSFDSDPISILMLFQLFFISFLFTYILIQLLWNFFGKEKITIDNHFIHFQKTIFGLGIYKKFPKTDVIFFKNKKVDFKYDFYDAFKKYNPLSKHNFKGKIVIQGKNQNYTFAQILEDVDVQPTIELLNKKVKN